MATSTTRTNKPILPRGNDQSPKGYNRAALYSGKALDFDGVNDSIDISNFSLNGYTAFSICFHKTDDFNNAMIFSSADGLSDGINIYQVSPGYFRARLNGSNTDTDLEVSTKDGFFVLTYDGSNLNWYYEAQNIGSGTTSQTFAITNTTSTIARQSYAAAQYLNGQISGFKIFNTALTAAQVADLYNNPEKIVPTGVDESNLKLWLPMMEGAGTTAYDGSSTENGPNLIVNGDFATDSDWTKGTGWSIANGVASHDSSLGPGDLYQDFALTIGNSYKITIEITATDTTELYFMTDNGDYVEVTGSPIGVHSHVFVADESSHRVGVRGSGNWDGSVDNITLEELNFANHGTISGATYVNGVGSPVAQSAVMDWNKAKNTLIQSEDYSTVNWNRLSSTINATNITAPNGQDVATDLRETTANSQHGIGTFTGGWSTAENQVIGGFFKYNGRQYIQFAGLGLQSVSEAPIFDIQNGVVHKASTSNVCTDAFIEDYGNGWYKCTALVDPTGSALFDFSLSTQIIHDNYDYYTGDTSKGVYVWGLFQVENESTKQPYLTTLGEKQLTPVLLPQGLTSGRDITGVNLFENVRKQGALNLDGNSWAEVHDNESLDFGTGSFSLEIWSKAKYTSSGSIYNVLLTLGDNVSSGSTSSLYIDSSLNYTFRYDSTLIVAGGSSEGDWSHVVGVYDGTNINIYLNGSFVVQTAATATSKTNTYNKRIGTDTAGASRTYKDQIAQPRIYNRALTAEEVARNYNASKGIYQ